MIANTFFFVSYPETGPWQTGQAPSSPKRTLSTATSPVWTTVDSIGRIRGGFICTWGKFADLKRGTEPSTVIRLLR